MVTTELLAPVGTLETFFAAMDGGADAVYVGAPGLNARNLARDLRIEEIGAMIQRCHGLGKKLYIAANSLILEKELPLVVENLALLHELQPDGLIVQDLGLLRMVREFFPRLRLHGSTLMTAHNSDAVRFLASLGCQRVVLARELTLKEIAHISQRVEGTQLEVFIHGAMCFSYSGLCLFSSYLGGKSGLRGRCVQPCRRSYTSASQGRKGTDKRSDGGKYLFSMNDLNGLEAVPELLSRGVSSLKIEGRLRSAHYVRNIVLAYRKMIDAYPAEGETALNEARSLAEQAMSRKTSPGYFFSPQPPEAITAHHSGNMGTYLGRFSVTKTVGEKSICRFITRAQLMVGDRLRLHVEPGGDRTAYRLKTLYVTGEQRETADAGVKVSMTVPEGFHLQPDEYAEVYKVDGPAATARPGDLHSEIDQTRKHLGQAGQKIRSTIASLTADICPPLEIADDNFSPTFSSKSQSGRRADPRRKMPLQWWLKTDNIKLLLGDLPFSPDRFLLAFDKQLLSQVGRIKSGLGRRARMVTWALPPLMSEGELASYRKQVEVLMRSGFRSFQLGHLSQRRLFEGEKVHLCTDYTVNLLNSQAVQMAKECGMESVQAALETDKQSLAGLLAGSRSFGMSKQSGILPVGLTVYGTPALYTSRLAAGHFQYERQIYSPRNEAYVIRKAAGGVAVYPEKPFSLLPYLDELKQIGIGYVVVDISGGAATKRNLQELGERLNNTGRYSKLATFNYLGKLE